MSITKREFRKKQKILSLALQEAEKEAIQSGVNVVSIEYDQAVLVLREKILNKLGLTPEQYEELRLNFKPKKKPVSYTELTNVPPAPIIPVPINTTTIVNKIVKEITREKPITNVIKELRTEVIKELDRTELEKMGQEVEQVRSDLSQLQSSFVSLYGRVEQIKIPETKDWTEELKDLHWQIDNINTRRASIFNRSDAGSFTTAIADSRYYRKSEIDALISTENLFDRTGTTITPHTAGDSLNMGTGNITAFTVIADAGEGVYWGSILTGDNIYHDPVSDAFTFASNATFLYQFVGLSGNAIWDFSLLSTNRNFVFPDADGTIALTSDLALYVPYTGATGAVNLGAQNLTTTGIGTIGTVKFGSATGVSATATNGILTLAGLKVAGNNENLKIDFEASANYVTLYSSTGAHLALSMNIEMNSGYIISTDAGSAAVPAFNFGGAGDGHTGFYRAANDNFAIATAGVQAHQFKVDRHILGRNIDFDLLLVFDGATSDGTLTYKPDVSQFVFTQSVLTNSKIGILEGGASPTKYTYFQGGDQTIDLTYTWPTAYPTVSGQVLSSTTAGVMSWVAAGSGSQTPWTSNIDGAGYDLTMSAGDIITDTVTGTKIGTGATQKIGLWGTAPVVQPTAIADIGGTYTMDDLKTTINNILARLRLPGIIAT